MEKPPELGPLRAELRAAGLFEMREADSWAQLVTMLTGVVVCLALIISGPLWLAILLTPVVGVLCTSSAMLGHEGSHKSFSKSPARNAFVAHAVFPLLSGLSALFWHNKHDVLHHGHPNVQGKDTDIEPFPFTQSLEDHERAGAKRKWFQRNLQRYLFWPMSTLMAIGMRRNSILYMIAYRRKRGVDRAWVADLVCLIGHYTLWVIVPSIIFGPLHAIGLYAGVWAVSGICLALIFAPAHIGMPVLHDQHHDWLHQLETTRNLELPRFVSWFFIGLDYQVEHHLFPKIPHQSLPKAAEIVAAWCKRENVVYHSVPYLYALADTARFMGTAWARPATDPKTVREGRWLGASAGLKPAHAPSMPDMAPRADVIGL